MAAKKKVKMGKTAKTKLILKETPERTLPLLEKFLQYGLLLIALLSPYYRGLYFDYERYPFFFMIFLIAVVYFIYQATYLKKGISLKTPVEYIFLLLVILYGLSIFWAADKGMAFREFFSNVTYFIFFLLVTHLFQTRRSKKILLITFSLNSVLLILLGLFYRFGWINPLSRPLGMSMKDLFLESSGRLYSTMQYPNTFATYIALAIITLILVLLLEEKQIYFGLWGLVLFPLQAGLYFTYSRGALLVFIITLVFMFISLGIREKIKYILILAAAFAWTLFFTPRLENFLFSNLPGQFFGFLILGSVVQALSIYFLSFVWKKPIKLPKLSIRALYLIIGIGIALVIVFFVVSGQKPEFLSNRFRQITFQTIISQERWIFYNDGLKIFRTRPIAGWGGGGWEAHYLAHQSYSYFSKNAHNYFLQVIIEVGVIGLLLTIGLIAGLFYQIYRFRKTNKDSWDALLALGLGIVVFLGYFHGLIDVDFALGSFQLGVLMFMALINQITQSQGNYIGNRRLFEMKISSWGLLVVASFLLIFSLFLITGERAKLWGDHYQSYGEINRAIQYHQKAVNYIPFNSQSHYALSTLYRKLYQTQKQPGLRIRSEYHSDKATNYSPYNYRFRENKAILKIEKGEFETGLIEFEKAIYLAPFISTTYEHYLQTCISVADFYLRRSEKEKAVSYLEKGLVIDNIYTNFLEKSIRPVKKPDSYNNVLQELKTKLQEIKE